MHGQVAGQTLGFLSQPEVVQKPLCPGWIAQYEVGPPHSAVVAQVAPKAAPASLADPASLDGAASAGGPASLGRLGTHMCAANPYGVRSMHGQVAGQMLGV